ncbi:hypothetical protein FS842_004686 [Serendipita sp. 407]|nr:hypothetical protein FS842_004686 [Serendipita sp. 407]
MSQDEARLTSSSVLLDETQVNLLHQLEDLSSTTNDIETDKRVASQLIREEYNMSVTKQLERTPTPCCRDPCRRLPEELFLQILEEVSKVLDGTPYWSINSVLQLMMVSKSWEAVILSAPQLWSEITISRDVDTRLKIAVSLALSKTVPLRIRFLCPVSDWSIVEQLLSSHRAMIAHVTIIDHLGSSDAQEIGTDAFILANLGHLPRLRSLECYSGYYGGSTISSLGQFVGENLQITNISGIWLTQETCTEQILTRLSMFQTLIPPSQILEDLKRMGRLKTVQFGSPGSLDITRPPKTSPGGVPPQIGNGWTSYSEYGYISLPLIATSTASLVVLDLKMSIADVGDLLSISYQFHRLRKVSLHLRIGGPHNFTPPTSHLPSSTVTDLAITFGCISPAIHSTLEPSVKHFPEALHQVFPNVRSLVVGDPSVPLQWSLISSTGFKALRELYVSRWREKNHPPPFFQLPERLETLTVANNDSGAGLSGLHSHSVKFLTLYIAGSQDSQTFDPSLWPSLIKISLDVSITILWKSGALRNLRSIHFDWMFNTAWDYVSEFCRDLTLYSSTMPSMESISFSEPPEWDLLFILLEHYNFRPEVGSCRISTLSIKSNVPSYLVDPLAELCTGRFVKRPPNVELSWVGNMDIITDLSL